MKRTKWCVTQELGTLYVEEVLVIFDVPELFVCIDEHENRYLVLFIENERGDYLLSEIGKASLAQMLAGEIPMNEAFRTAPNGKVYYLSFIRDELADAAPCDCEEIPDADLPEEGAFFTLKNKKIKAYYSYLLSCEARCQGTGFTVSIADSPAVLYAVH